MDILPTPRLTPLKRRSSSTNHTGTRKRQQQQLPYAHEIGSEEAAEILLRARQPSYESDSESEDEVVEKRHSPAARLRARLGLALFKVKTNQTQTPFRELVVPGGAERRELGVGVPPSSPPPQMEGEKGHGGGGKFWV